MRHVFAFAVLSLSVAGCLAPSGSPEPDETAAPLDSAHTDADPRESIATDSADAGEQIGEAADEDAVGAIVGAIGGGVAGTLFGGLVFGPWGALVFGLTGTAVAGYYGDKASGDRPPWPGSPPQIDPWSRPKGDSDR